MVAGGKLKLKLIVSPWSGTIQWFSGISVKSVIMKLSL